MSIVDFRVSQLVTQLTLRSIFCWLMSQYSANRPTTLYNGLIAKRNIQNMCIWRNWQKTMWRFIFDSFNCNDRLGSTSKEFLFPLIGELLYIICVIDYTYFWRRQLRLVNLFMEKLNFPRLYLPSKTCENFSHVRTSSYWMGIIVH